MFMGYRLRWNDNSRQVWAMFGTNANNTWQSKILRWHIHVIPVIQWLEPNVFASSRLPWLHSHIETVWTTWWDPSSKWQAFKVLKIYLLYIYEYLASMYVCEPCVYLVTPHTHIRKKMMVPEVMIAASYCVNTWNWNQVLCKSNKCSECWIISPSPIQYTFFKGMKIKVIVVSNEMILQEDYRNNAKNV